MKENKSLEEKIIAVLQELEEEMDIIERIYIYEFYEVKKMEEV
jgi:hypothetical protein